MKHIISILVTFFLIIFLFPSFVLAATPHVTSLSASESQVGRYEKFEVTFEISKTYPVLPPSASPPLSDLPDAFLPYYYYESSSSHTW